MTKFGHTFSVEALQETAEDELKDFERIALERGWNQEEKDSMKASLLVLKNPDSSREDIVQALDDIEDVDSEYAKKLTGDAKEIHLTKTESNIKKDVSVEVDNESDDFLADMDIPMDIPDDISMPTGESSIISPVFSQEVAGVGANAVSHMPQPKTPNISDTNGPNSTHKCNLTW